MVKIYARLCEKGKKNFNDVPNELQSQVRAIIEDNGYVINPDGTVTPVGDGQE